MKMRPSHLSAVTRTEEPQVPCDGGLVDLRIDAKEAFRLQGRSRGRSGSGCEHNPPPSQS